MFENFVEAAAFLVAMLTLPLGILCALFLGLTPAATVFVVGWLLLTPLLLFVGTELLPMLRNRTDDGAEAPETDPLDELKTRYARGEIDEREFERRVDRLVELDTGDTGGVDAADPDGFDPADRTLAAETE
ncbi:hypothetical protein C475_03274 [Halosimplex carlsbadense 2-9-1]|uniref:SHOCT domain-containing protein n=1 Tax=Halosimplex carlsbadense 2-9-1 TaxID=797114 RepID=M0D186_9EURY|nr:SHOCT domain-containing protein [Halosimplex carlsbadense]ELZ29205.1 hypothetical protein C475_03274 [Halosimplex carlsbadense 2-9-1]